MIGTIRDNALRVKQKLYWRMRAKYRENYEPAPVKSVVGNDIISMLLLSGQPFAAGKIGAYELQGFRALRGDRAFTRLVRKRMYINTGVFPDVDEIYDAWAVTYGRALKELDLLAVWNNPGEAKLIKDMNIDPRLTWATALEPFFFDEPWSQHLEGKRVVVVTPFYCSIPYQYHAVRQGIWENPKVLPDFDLRVVRAPYPPALTGSTPYPDWFRALEVLTDWTLRENPDVVLVGAGAYSLPLCAAVKKAGASAIYTGGGTQILFGVLGSHWKNKSDFYKRVVNEKWSRPYVAERPKNYKLVERGRYW